MPVWWSSWHWARGGCQSWACRRGRGSWRGPTRSGTWCTWRWGRTAAGQSWACAPEPACNTRIFGSCLMVKNIRHWLQSRKVELHKGPYTVHFASQYYLYSIYGALLVHCKKLWNRKRRMYKKKMPELSMSSKSPTKNTEWRWWKPPNKMQRMDPASGEHHNKNKTLPKRFYLDHRKSSLKYTQVSKIRIGHLIFFQDVYFHILKLYDLLC